MAWPLSMMVAAHTAILQAPLYYRHLERIKREALRRGLTYDAKLRLNSDTLSDLRWWLAMCSHHNTVESET